MALGGAVVRFYSIDELGGEVAVVKLAPPDSGRRAENGEWRPVNACPSIHPFIHLLSELSGTICHIATVSSINPHHNSKH